MQWADGVPRPDHGPGMGQRLCAVCGASWVGRTTDGCGWCARADEQLIDNTRRALLTPTWLHSDAGNPRYDELDEAGKAVWDRTRGQSRGADSVVMWAARLRRAVDAGWITGTEARAAMRRVLPP